MGDTTILRAKLTGMIRQQDGRSRFMVKRGVTTAHAGAEIARSHPHLWEPIEVDFPVEGAELTDAAVEAAGTSHTEALRAILRGLESRGYELRAASEDQVPDQLVALVFSAIDHPRGGQFPPQAEASVLLGRGVDPEPTVPDGDQADTFDPDEPESAVGMPAPGDQGTHDLEDDEDTDAAGTPSDVADPTTKEGRAAIREWAGGHGFEVSSSGPIRQEILDAWAAEQGGRA